MGGQERHMHAAINPHLSKVLVSPVTLTSTHRLIDCKADQYLSLQQLQQQPAKWAGSRCEGAEIYTLSSNQVLPCVQIKFGRNSTFLFGLH